MPEGRSASGLATAKIEDLRSLVNTRIETLRPRLLDLSRRNPLVSTKLTPRSNSHVRVVDELPDVLFANLSAQTEMRFVPLPNLEDDPRDEQSREFQNALSESRLTDEEYKEQADNIDPSAEDSAQLYRELERKLKDKVRESLSMSPRQTIGSISLKQHATNNGISASYDLPYEAEQHEDGRHKDEDIQMLLLPDDLDRKMSALMTKCRTWIQETGINVLYAAFGFLEWGDSSNNQSGFAPLVLLPVSLEKAKTKEGTEFRVIGIEDAGETNTVLVEKLKTDFGIAIPRFETGTLEEYFAEIANLAPTSISWKVRRQVVFGVFPSTRLAMYQDLDTSALGFESSHAVTKLLAGTESNIASVYGDEYEVDEPSIEQKVPCLVLDADSSQFSTIVDVADGKDLAVEGPPGTGKSQTIVNTIASMLYSGKKVLFVAEKLAALDVVKSRLEAIGLGEFILPLQAERSTKEQVIQSITDRIEMSVEIATGRLLAQTAKFKETRAELQSYVDVMASQVEGTGYKVFDIIGKSVSCNSLLENLPKSVQNPPITGIAEYNSSKIQSLKEMGTALEEAWLEMTDSKPHWLGLTMQSLDRFSVAELSDLTEKAAELSADCEKLKIDLGLLGLDELQSTGELEAVIAALRRIAPYENQLDIELLSLLQEKSNLGITVKFATDCTNNQLERAQILSILNCKPAVEHPIALRSIYDLCLKDSLDTVDLKKLRSNHVQQIAKLSGLKKLHKNVQPFIKFVPEAVDWTIDSLKAAHALVLATDAAVLALRNDAALDPTLPSVIGDTCQRARKLIAQRTELEKVMNLKRNLATCEQIEQQIKALQPTGLISKLMPAYTGAKKTYVETTRRGSFSQAMALKDLNEFLCWKEEIENFETNKNSLKVFGSDFSIASDFDMFEKLGAYYTGIENALPGISNRTLRKFLKTADFDLLQSLPSVEQDLGNNEIQCLNDDIEKLEKAIEKNTADLNEFEALTSFLSRPDELSVKDLRPLADRIEKYLGQKKELDSAEGVRAILQNRFDGAQTSVASIERELSAAQEIERLKNNGKFIIEIARNNRLNEARESGELMLTANQQFDLALEAVANKSGLSVSELKKRAAGKILSSFLAEASQDKEGIYTHTKYELAQVEVRRQGFDWLIQALLGEGRRLNTLGQIVEAVCFRALAKFVYQRYDSVLSKYHGRKLDDCRLRLATLDKEIQKLSQQKLRSKLCSEAKPPSGISLGRKSEFTEMALIENERAKKKRFCSVRELTQKAGSALLELKPCWMMSPLAVAQYIRKEDIKFDLVIIDEASQMPPEDAMGALMRAKQVMVVGDTNQLPPTSFFRKMLDEDDADEDEIVAEESILEMANGAFRPARRLKWHYRSRHSALINFSNHMVYDGELIVFPSASEQRPDMGVSLVAVQGRYSAGTNGEEAKAMIDATLNFMRTHPNRSLGLVVLNQKQRDLLLEEWNYALSKDPAASKYVERWSERNQGLESFFIKNLENVQGDERDVIFIGTVCGPENLGGQIDHRCFGPVNGLTGKRRLNVLFSRAKEQVITFSSMTSADIRADENSNQGLYMLKRWLEYSATGFIHTGIKTNKRTDSDFEDYVIAQIKSMGCEPVPQVGAAGYFIDIGIKHPEWPHGYILAVECDGATYHSSKSARDRDRLRQQVLEGLGWKFHRIWSTDWFTDPRKEAERLREVISLRLSELRHKTLSFEKPAITSNTERASNNETSSTIEATAEIVEQDSKDDLEDSEFLDSEEPSSDQDLELHQPDESTSTSRKPQEVSNEEIKQTILLVLKACPNNSCTTRSLAPRVLKVLGIITRGKPMVQFKQRVAQSIINLVYKDKVEKYRTERNDRVRLR